MAAGSAVCCFGFVYLASTYLASYAQTRLGYSRGSILFDSVLGGLLCIVFTALSSALCDQLGRRRVLLAGWAVALPWSLLVMPLIDSGSPSLFAVAVVGMYAIGGFGFDPRHRSSQNCLLLATDTRAARSRRISLGLPAARYRR